MENKKLSFKNFKKNYLNYLNEFKIFENLNIESNYVIDDKNEKEVYAQLSDIAKNNKLKLSPNIEDIFNSKKKNFQIEFELEQKNLFLDFKKLIWKNGILSDGVFGYAGYGNEKIECIFENGEVKKTVKLINVKILNGKISGTMESCIVENGEFKGSVIENTEIYNGKFEKCKLSYCVVKSKNIVELNDCRGSEMKFLEGKIQVNGGKYYGGDCKTDGMIWNNANGRLINWYAGTWNGGKLDKGYWAGGIWNGGKFYDSYWENGVWNGKPEDFVKSVWEAPEDPPFELDYL